MPCTVMNLCTNEKQVYTCEHRMAVICAYAQSNGDYNTWDYEKNYSHLIMESNFCYNCGDFGVYKDGRKF